MKIRLEFFRCWEELDVNLVSGLNLIKGKSGRGKTTILKAIHWCLYGTSRKVYPSGKEKAKTKVILELDGFKIERRRNPNRLILYLNDQIFEDQIAQEIINQTYITPDVWTVTSYVEQKQLNSFLLMTNNGKMDILRQMSFNEEDPQHYIQTINNKVNELKEQYTILISDFEKESLIIKKEIDANVYQYLFSDDQIKDINAKKNNLTINLSDLSSQQENYKINVALKNKLDQELSKLMEPFIPVMNDFILETSKEWNHDLSNSEETLKIVQKLLSEAEQQKIWKEKLDSLPQISDISLPELDEIEISKIEKLHGEISILEMEIDYNKSLCGNIAYNFLSLKEEILRCQNILSTREQLLLKQEIETLECQINKIRNEINNESYIKNIDITPNYPTEPDFTAYAFDDSELKELEKEYISINLEINHMRKLVSLPQSICPHCNNTIVCQGNCVTCPISNIELNNLEEKKNMLQLKIKQLHDLRNKLQEEEKIIRQKYTYEYNQEQSRLRSNNEELVRMNMLEEKRIGRNEILNQQISELINELDKLGNKPDIKGEILSKQEYVKIYQTYNILLKVKLIDPPRYNSAILKQYLEKRRRDIKREKLQKKIEPGPNYNKIKRYYDELQLYFNQYSQEQKKLEEYNSRKNHLLEQIDSIKIGSDLSSEINKCKEDIKLTELYLSNYQHACQIYNKHNKILQDQEKIFELNSSIENYRILEQYAKDAECLVLQQNIDTINRCINDICNSLFEDNMTVCLSPFKTYKSNDNVKPIINFTITHKGCVYDNFSDLSGGEKDRLSIALTIAFNKISASPILILDETLGSLDGDTKDIVQRTIREHVTDIPVLVVMQEGVEGYYDNVIDI